MTVVRTRRSPARTLPALACAILTLASCGGSSTSPPGTPVITLADTSGEFASYRVSINSISLTNTNGTVSTLPLVSQVVDLATLTDLSELLEAPAFPAGTYKSAAFALDFTSLSIWVNLNGQGVSAKAVNASGTTPTGLVTVNITFDPNNQLTVTAGKSSHLAIDIDLAASNSIDTSGSPPTVTVQPFVVITPAPADSTPMRVRGLFVTAQTGASNYVINSRPLNDQGSAVGAVTVSTDANTYFNVGGVAYTGAAGLAAMTSLTENTPVAAYGTLGDLSGITPGFRATAVYAGTSLESPLADHITGVVSARSGNTLTVRGAHLLSRQVILSTCPVGYYNVFFNNATVTIGSGTVVSEDGVAASGLGPASVSVGQQIDVSGQCAIDSSGNVTLDATAGQLRLASTRIWGTLNSATPASANLDVLTLGNFAPAGFNFAGTGTPVTNPAAYVVNTGTLDESAVAAGTLLEVNGIVRPFGAAPPDFAATAISPGTATEQRLVIEWVNGGATAPFSAASASGLVVDLGNPILGTIHHIRTGPATLDLKSLPTSPLITTTGADQSNLRLAIGSTALSTGISVFNSASGFASAVSSAFTGTNKIYRLVAVGQFNGAANTFVASRISLALHE